MTRKLTEQQVEQRLFGRSIKMIDSYINNKIKINFQCLKYGCDYIWLATPDNIMSGKGCPKCAKLLPLTNEIVDGRLISKQIKRVGTIINSYTAIQFICLTCNYGSNGEWKVRPHTILNNNTGCPNCAGVVHLTNELVDIKLLERNIKRLSDYININIPIHWQCLVCEYGANLEWKTSPNNILNGEKGCPICKIGKNEKLVYSILNENGISSKRHQSLKELGCANTYYVDFYITKYNTIIEYNGQQHYEIVRFGNMSEEDSKKRFERQIKRDLNVQKFCELVGIRLIWIDGRKYTNSKLKTYLLSEILPTLK